MGPPRYRAAGERILVDYGLRHDYRAKPGGDTVQIERTLAAGRSLFNASLAGVTRAWRPRNGAVVHLVNIDREFDFLLALRRIPVGQSIVLSPIYHSRDALSQLQRNRSTGVRALLERHLSRDLMIWGSYLIRQRRLDAPELSLAVRGRLRREVRRQLATRVSHLVFLAEGERNRFESYFDVRLPYSVIPNGIPEPTTVPRWAERDVPLLIPGRIELRKNQLNAARALAASKQEALFVGRPNPRDSHYVERFREVVDSAQQLRWIPGVSPNEMPEIYQRARVVWNPSFVEVLSLVDLEAVGYGCGLVTTSSGNTREWLHDVARYHDPMDLQQGINEVKSLLSKGAPSLPSDVAKRLSWRMVAKSLAEVYSRLRTS